MFCLTIMVCYDLIMPRQSRIVVQNCPHHIMQRGHNSQVVFHEKEDYVSYLASLKEWKIKLKCKVYAYCLMPNHIHLIVDPGDRIENLGLMMKRLAGRYTRRVNKRTQRTGSLWEGRFKSSPIQASEYLLACSRYVDMNPVRLGLVSKPDQYSWSSCRYKVGTEILDWLDLDPFYQSLGRTRLHRCLKYQEWLNGPVPESELKVIRQAVKRGQVTANTRYTEVLSEQFGRDLTPRGPGRPKKNT